MLGGIGAPGAPAALCTVRSSVQAGPAFGGQPQSRILAGKASGSPGRMAMTSGPLGQLATARRRVASRIQPGAFVGKAGDERYGR